MYFSYLDVQWNVSNSATRKNGGKYYFIKQSNTQLVMISNPCRGIQPCTVSMGNTSHSLVSSWALLEARVEDRFTINLGLL